MSAARRIGLKRKSFRDDRVARLTMSRTACIRLMLTLSLLIPLSNAMNYTDINASQAYELLSSDPSVFLLDVRSLSEYVAGHIPGAYHIPHDVISQREAELPEGRNRSILVYCQGGYRSSLASAEIAEIGYNRVQNMAGGFASWSELGYPVMLGSDTGVFEAGEASRHTFIFMVILSLVAAAGSRRWDLRRGGKGHRTADPA